MSFPARYAILLDGAFVNVKLKALLRRFPSAQDISDLVPAFKFARREGMRVYLDHLKHGVMRELKAHADIVMDVALNPARAKALAQA